MTDLLVAVLSLFSVPFFVLAVCVVFAWAHDRAENRRARRLARELDACLARILSGRSRPPQPPEQREWRIS